MGLRPYECDSLKKILHAVNDGLDHGADLRRHDPHTVPPCRLIYFLLKRFIILQKGQLNTAGIGGIDAPMKLIGEEEEMILIYGRGKIKTLLKFLLMDHRKGRDITKKLVICY